jgi:hypothetical protein
LEDASGRPPLLVLPEVYGIHHLRALEEWKYHSQAFYVSLDDGGDVIS